MTHPDETGFVPLFDGQTLQGWFATPRTYGAMWPGGPTVAEAHPGLFPADYNEQAAAHPAVWTVEEGAIMGGAGSAVLEALQDLQLPKPVLALGIGDVFTEHGDPAKLLAEMGLDAAGIQASIEKRFATLLN